jgi:predicted membrane-bound spermidine synthase
MRARVLGLMFCLGAFSTITQVVLMREMLVVFFGNELTIAAILASWLICVGTGAALARGVVDRLPAAALRWILAVLAIGLCGILPGQLVAVRVLRGLLGVAFGEYAPLTSIVLGAVCVCAPACLATGFSFPVACAVLEHADPDRGGDPRGVSHVYTCEALGSMLAGLGVTFVLLVRVSPLAVVLIGVAPAALAAGLIAPWRGGRVLGSAVALCLVGIAVASPGWMEQIEHGLVRLRWHSFGVLSSTDSSGNEGVRLLHSEDSRYQNLAVTELAGQYSLYGNGEVLFSFPDLHSDEHAMHFVMAQNPGAKRVLMLGANPLGEIEEVLKYGVERVVYVELDPDVVRVLSAVQPDRMREALADPRLECMTADGVRYLLRCEETFDVVIVNAPAPTTAAANRFYTVEFFRCVARVLADDGFVFTSLDVSERLMDDAATLGGSLFRTLNHVFETVLVTAESGSRFLAGPSEAALTFDRQTLYTRSRSAGVATEFFRPEYFLGEDALTGEKRARVRQRFTEAGGALNRSVQPVTYFNNLVVWSRFSGSGATGLLRRLRGLRATVVMAWIVGFGVFCLSVSCGVWCWVQILAPPGQARAGAEGQWGASSWGRGMVLLLLASTGACGMALEVLLIFVYQSLYGYVYGRIGLIVGLFMLGLVAGAPSGRWLAARGHRLTVCMLGSIEALLLAFACMVPGIMRFASISGSLGEGVICLCVAVVGWAVGAEFPLANGLLRRAGASVGGAAAVADASDHLGAAVGALAVGVLLLPVLGIEETGLVLASVKASSLLCLAGAATALMPRRRG